MGINEFMSLSPKERKSLLKDIDLVDITKEIIRTSDSQQIRKGILRPSSIGSGSGKLDGYDVGCPRALWYGYFNYPKEEQTTESKIRTAVGTAYHSVLETFYRGAEQRIGKIKDIKLEYPLSQDRETYAIEGSCDALIEFKDGRLMVIDFKTIGTKSFAGLQQPHDYHKTQVHTYMYLSDAPLGGLLYVATTDMGKLLFKDATFGWSQSRWNAVEKRLKQVEQYILNMEPPPAEGSFKYCTEWCPYRKTCRLEGNKWASSKTSHLDLPPKSKHSKLWWKN